MKKQAELDHATQREDLGAERVRRLVTYMSLLG